MDAEPLDQQHDAFEPGIHPCISLQGSRRYSKGLRRVLYEIRTFQPFTDKLVGNLGMHLDLSRDSESLS